jgi:hypothetical protein
VTLAFTLCNRRNKERYENQSVSSIDNSSEKSRSPRRSKSGMKDAKMSSKQSGNEIFERAPLNTSTKSTSNSPQQQQKYENPRRPASSGIADCNVRVSVGPFLEPYTPTQVFLTSDEVNHLSNEIWKWLGVNCIGIGNAQINQKKFEIVKTFFREHGYLHVDDNWYNSHPSKKKYFEQSTESERQNMADLDVRAISWAVVLCDRRNIEKHRTSANPNDTINSTNHLTQIPSVFTNDPFTSHGSSGKSMLSKASIPVTGTNSLEVYTPTQVVLNSKELEELSKKVQNAIVTMLTDRGQRCTDYREVKYKAVHSYFQEKGYLHIEDGVGRSQLMRDYVKNASIVEKQRLSALDRISINRAITLCDRWNNEKLINHTRDENNNFVEKSKNSAFRHATRKNAASSSDNISQLQQAKGKKTKQGSGSKMEEKSRTRRPNSLIFTEEQRKSLEQAKDKEIYCAVKLVASALNSGPWPSPVRSFEPDSVHERNNSFTLAELIGESVDYDIDEIMREITPDDVRDRNVSDDGSTKNKVSDLVRAHQDHVEVVVASIKQFTHDVIRPKIMEDLNIALTEAAEMGEMYDNGPLRVFLGTLLMLREVMAQNAVEIFGPTASLSGKESDFSEHMGTGSVAPTMTEEQSSTHTAKLMATAVIIAGLAQLEDASEHLTEQFLGMISEYEYVISSITFALSSRF